MPSDVRKVYDLPFSPFYLRGYALLTIQGRSPPKILSVRVRVGQSRHRTSAGIAGSLAMRSVTRSR